MRIVLWILFWLLTIAITATISGALTMYSVFYFAHLELETSFDSLPLAAMYAGEWISQLLHYIGRIVESLFPWPVVVLTLGMGFFFTTNSFSFLLGLVRLVKKIKILGTEVEFSEGQKSHIR